MAYYKEPMVVTSLYRAIGLMFCGVIAGWGLGAAVASPPVESSPVSSIRILNIGDSLSKGTHLQTLQARFVEIGFSGYEFVGPVKKGGIPKKTDRQAYGGMRLGAMLNGRVLDGDAQTGAVVSIPEYRPEVVLLMGGINNIVGLRSEDLEPIQKEWNELVDYLVKKLPESRIFASNVIRVHPDRRWSAKQPLIDRFNAWIKQEVAARARTGQKITFVDQSGSISPDDFRSDGLHLLESGQTKIGNAWFEALLESGILPKSRE